MHMYVQTPTYKPILKYIHTYNTYIHTYIDTHAHTYISLHIYVYTCTYIYTCNTKYIYSRTSIIQLQLCAKINLR